MGQEKRGIDFVRNKIKWTIAEIIFQYMFAEREFATVLPFGYEHLTPTLAQYQHLLDAAAEIKDIRNMPDFLLIKPDNKHVALVDVKYRRKKEPERIKEIAARIHKRWETAWIFLATLEGFFFAPCSVILENNGDIPPLPQQWIPQDIQDTYFRLMLEFER